MTRATLAKSSGRTSACSRLATISTSYGREPDRLGAARPGSTLVGGLLEPGDHRLSWSSAVVAGSTSYVAGKRKPSALPCA